MSRAEALAGGEDLVSGGNVLPRTAHVGARADGFFDQDPAALRPGVLDHAHGVGAFGYGGPGHYAYRFAFPYDHAAGVVAGHEHADHAEPGRGHGHISERGASNRP